MRLMSFALTTPQFRTRTKTVTRRLGWRHAKVGDIFMGVEKAMGRKKGEPLVKLGMIRVTDVRREPLDAITKEDVVREGFPGMYPSEFTAMFCKHMGCGGSDEVTRIEFEYVDEARGEMIDEQRARLQVLKQRKRGESLRDKEVSS